MRLAAVASVFLGCAPTLDRAMRVEIEPAAVAHGGLDVSVEEVRITRDAWSGLGRGSRVVVHATLESRDGRAHVVDPDHARLRFSPPRRRMPAVDVPAVAAGEGTVRVGANGRREIRIEFTGFPPSTRDRTFVAIVLPVDGSPFWVVLANPAWPGRVWKADPTRAGLEARGTAGLVVLSNLLAEGVQLVAFAGGAESRTELAVGPGVVAEARQDRTRLPMALLIGVRRVFGAARFDTCCALSGFVGLEYFLTVLRPEPTRFGGLGPSMGARFVLHPHRDVPGRPFRIDADVPASGDLAFSLGYAHWFALGVDTGSSPGIVLAFDAAL